MPAARARGMWRGASHRAGLLSSPRLPATEEVRGRGTSRRNVSNRLGTLAGCYQSWRCGCSRGRALWRVRGAHQTRTQRAVERPTSQRDPHATEQVLVALRKAASFSSVSVLAGDIGSAGAASGSYGAKRAISASTMPQCGARKETDELACWAEARRICPALPAGRVEAADRPDLRIEIDSGVVGIEVTEVVREAGEDGFCPPESRRHSMNRSSLWQGPNISPWGAPRSTS